MIEYVLMTKEHVSQVAALEKASFHSPWSEAAIAGELANELALWLVAIDAGTVVGYVGSQTVLEEADMMNIAVASGHRRQGIAEALVIHLIKELTLRKAHSLTLEVRISNEPAKALYGKLGFVQVGRRPNYYCAPREDALILRKEWVV